MRARDRARCARHCRRCPLSVDTRKVRGRGRGARRRRGPAQRRLGRHRRRMRSRASPAARDVPYVLMHDRQPRRATAAVVAEVVADLDRAPSTRRWPWAVPGSRSSSIRASASARPRTRTWRCCASCGRSAELGRPVLLGASRKSTIGRVLDLPAGRAAGGNAGDDRPGDRGRRRHRAGPRCPRQPACRAHGRRHRPGLAAARAGDTPMTDRPDTILLQGIRLEGCHGVSDEERALPQMLEVDLVVEADLRARRRLRRPGRHGRLRAARQTAAVRWSRTAAIDCWRPSPACHRGAGAGDPGRARRSRSGCASSRSP